MATAHHRPPEHATRIPYEILRCKEKRSLTFLCLSDEPLVIPTHWTGRRSILCPEGDCGYCKSHKEQRWRGYVYGRSLNNNRIGIIEYTGGVGGMIADFWEQHGGLFGATITLTRRGSAKNAMLTVAFADEWQRPDMDKPLPDLLGILCRVYEIKDSRRVRESQEDNVLKMQQRHA